MTVQSPNIMTMVTLKESAQNDSNFFHKENNEGFLIFAQVWQYVKGWNSSKQWHPTSSW